MPKHKETIRLPSLTIEVPVECDVYGHKEPWPCGHVVTFADHMSPVGGQGYREIGIRARNSNDNHFVKLPFNSKGIICDNRFGLALYATHLYVNAGRLENQSVLMWYWVAFNDEFLWVRCDWLKSFTE